MPGDALLAKGLIKTHGASYRNVQRFDDPHLRYDKITVAKVPYLFADPLMLIPKDKGHPLCQVDVIEPDGLTVQVSCQYPFVLAAQAPKAFRCIRKLMDRKPAGGAAAAFGAPFLMTGDTGIEYIYLLHPHGIAGPHDG